MKAPTVGCSSWCWGGLFLADASSQEPLGPGWGRVSPEKAGGGAGSVAGRGAGRRRRSPGRRRMWVGVQILDCGQPFWYPTSGGRGGEFPEKPGGRFFTAEVMNNNCFQHR